MFIPVIPVNLELLGSVHALQGAKTLHKNVNFSKLFSRLFSKCKTCTNLQGHFAGPCDKLEELCPVSLIEASQSAPEPRR